jgi:hypothetical protein
VIAVALGLAAALLLTGCAPQPTPSSMPTSSTGAALPTAGPSTSPVSAPEPTPTLVRFDIENGSREVIVWMTSDRGANAMRMLPGERRSLVVPLSEGTSIEVYADACELVAQVEWIPGTSPATIVLIEDSSGSGYQVEVRPGVSGPPNVPAAVDGIGCSG